MKKGIYLRDGGIVVVFIVIVLTNIFFESNERKGTVTVTPANEQKK